MLKTQQLRPQYTRPSRVISKVGKVVYRLDLPEELSQIHRNFHFSKLRNFVVDDSTVVPIDDIQVDDRLNYDERPTTASDRKTKALRTKVVSLVKVQWTHRKGSKWTCEVIP